MAKKYFYSHIIEITEISLEIGNLDISKKDRVELISLAEENHHNALLHLVLDHLHDDDKKPFLSHLAEENHDEAWDFVVKKIEDLENKLIKESNRIREELRNDIRRVKK